MLTLEKETTSCLEEVKELLPLREPVDLNKSLFYVTAGSTHYTYNQEQIVRAEEVSRQPAKTRFHIYAHI